MLVYRITRTEYASTLEASGRAARWNLNDQFVLYTGDSKALSTLEMLAHRANISTAFTYKMLSIEIPDDSKYITEVKVDTLVKNWESVSNYHLTQRIGNMWYINSATLILKVPSALINDAHNYIINTRHRDFISKVKLVTTGDVTWDKRLLN